MADYYANKDLLERLPVDVAAKGVAAKVSPTVVAVVTRNLPGKMLEFFGRRRMKPFPATLEGVFSSCGIIFECEEEEEEEDRFSVLILTTASVFVRSDGTDPSQVEVDVYLSNGKICKGKVEACDFHYNLAVVKIKSNSPLETATLRSMDDTLSGDTHPIKRCRKDSKFSAYSNLYRIRPGTKVIALGRNFKYPHVLHVFPGVFSTHSTSIKLNCTELYWVNNANCHSADGGPVINDSGEVIGIMFYCRPFLPTNVVSRWWKHYKRNREYCRPWVGMDTANLYATPLAFLEQFAKSFPNVYTGVVVTKVEEGSPASCSGMHPKDVIVKCDGESVCSNLEFLEQLWEKSGKCVELHILRPSKGEKLNLRITVGETSSDKFYQWPPKQWSSRERAS